MRLRLISSILAKGSAFGAAFVAQMLAARWLGVDGYGAFAGLFTAATLLGILAASGTPFGALRFLPGYAALGHWDDWRGFLHDAARRVLLGLLLGALVLLPLVAWLSPPGAAMPALVVAALAVMATTTLTLTLQTLLQALGRAAAGEIAANLARGGLAVAAFGGLLLAGVPGTALAALSISAATGLLATITCLAALRGRLPAPLAGVGARADARAWRTTALVGLGSSGVAAVMERLDLLLVTLFRSAAEAGAYAAAARFALTIAFVTVAVNAVLLPRMAAAQAREDRAELRRIVAAGVALASGVTGAAGLALVLAGPWLLGLFGEGFAAALPALVILVVGQVGLAALGPGGGALLVAGRNRAIGVVLGIGLGTTLLAGLLLVPAFGMVGAAVATAAGNLALGTAAAIAAARTLGVDVTIAACWRRPRAADPGRSLGRHVPLALALGLALALPGRALADPPNGRFEQGGTPPAGWSQEAAAAAKGGLAILPAPEGVPGRLLELRPNARNTPGPRPLGLGQLIPAGPYRGREVTVSAVLGAEGGAAAVLGLVALRRDGGEAGGVFLRGAAAPQRQSERLAVPADPAVAHLVLFLAAEGTTGAARFADIAIAAAAPQAAPQTVPQAATRAATQGAPGAAAAAPALPASVTIDAARPLRRIPRGIFGTNIEVIRDANGLMDVARDRLEPALVDLARGLGIDTVRFPGGVWSDAYDWRLGVGPRAQRRPARVTPTDRETQANRFGTDEALEFAAAIGARLFITVNAGNGTPELAADWVRHVNGQGGANRRVTWWEIGNELYMANDASGGAMPPERYAERVVAFAAAMRAVDPGIRIAAIGLRNFGRYRFNAHDRWNEVVLRRAGHVIDLLAVHNGYAPVLTDPGRRPPEEVYGAMLGFPVLMAQNLRDTAEEIRRFAPDHAARIRLGVTEWGPLFAVDPRSPFIDHPKTLGSAVFVAEVLRVMAAEPAVEMAHFFKLNEASFMGWIGRRGSAWQLNAPAMAFRMVSRGTEPQLLPASVEVAGLDSPALGHVDAVRGAPALGVLPTLSEDGSRAAILLVNRHLASPVAARIRLAGLAGAAEARLELLTGDAPDAHTGTTLPAVPGLRWAEQAGTGPAGRMRDGAPGEVRLEQRALGAVGPTIELSLPPHSVALLRLEELRR